MHILYLSDSFPPEVNAPASRAFEHARRWVSLGNRVTVITCVPNYPDGEVHAGYRNRPYQVETIAGIEVVRVWSYIALDGGFGKKALDYLSYMVTATMAAPFARNADVIIGTSPQFFAACAAYLVSRLRNLPFAFEVRDLWPESIKAVNDIDDSALIRWLERLELFLYRRADAIIPVTHAFKRLLVARGVPANKISVVTNGADLSRFQPRPRDRALAEHYDLAGKFVVGYIGTHGTPQALETLLLAAKRLANLADGNRYRMMLVGGGPTKQALRARAEQLGVTNVIFVDTVPKEEIPRYWSVLDASIIHLKATPLFTTVIPSKLFESIAMGIPVVHGVAGESASIVEEEGVGVVFESERPEALSNTIERLCADATLLETCRTRCREAAQRYDRDALARRMLDILSELAPREESVTS